MVVRTAKNIKQEEIFYLTLGLVVGLLSIWFWWRGATGQTFSTQFVNFVLGFLGSWFAYRCGNKQKELQEERRELLRKVND